MRLECLMTAWNQSGLKGKVGGFQNPGVCLQAFPSLPFPSPLFFHMAILYPWTPGKHLLHRLLFVQKQNGCLEKTDLENTDLENADLENTDLENVVYLLIILRSFVLLYLMGKRKFKRAQDYHWDRFKFINKLSRNFKDGRHVADFRLSSPFSFDCQWSFRLQKIEHKISWNFIKQGVCTH